MPLPNGSSAPPSRTVCWTPTWSKTAPDVGLEHLLLTGNAADSVVLGVDDQRGPFRLAYRLAWDDAWRIRSAGFVAASKGSTRLLELQTDGQGHWRDGRGASLDALDGCLDIDVWPTPFTNTFPIRRQLSAIGQRCEFRMAWVDGLDLSVKPQPQAYTRLADRRYRFESLDGSGFQAELVVDEDGIVLDYPGLFRRVCSSSKGVQTGHGP